MLKYLCLLLFFFNLISCSDKKGTFAFFQSDESDLNEMESILYRPHLFKKMKPPATFDKNLKLWYIYEPSKIDYTNAYAISISKLSLGWIEIDLKNQKLNPSTGLIMDTLEDLQEGSYLLRIAYKNKVIDQFQFNITRLSEVDVIDYEAPISLSDDSKVEDDIIMNSHP